LQLCFTLFILTALIAFVQCVECPPKLLPIASAVFNIVDPMNPAQRVAFSLCNPSGCRGSYTCRANNCCSVCQQWSTGGACLGYLTSYDSSNGGINLYYEKGGDPVFGPPSPIPRATTIKLSCGTTPFNLTKYVDGANNVQNNTYMYLIEGTSQYACACDAAVCGTCASTYGCAWCFSEQQCESYPPNCSSWTTNPNFCNTDCSSYKTCNECAGSKCNWCAYPAGIGCTKNVNDKCELNVGDPKYCNADILKIEN